MKLILLFIFFVFPFSIFAQTIESDNFILTDGNGRTTAQLTKSGEGTPALFFYDGKWTPRISIGLYEDGVPGIVLNDEQWLATAILRMVNNQGNPALVLKENWQDKFIIDKNGIRSGKDSSWFSLLQIVLMSLASWAVWWYIASIIFQNRDKTFKNPLVSNTL